MPSLFSFFFILVTVLTNFSLPCTAQVAPRNGRNIGQLKVVEPGSQVYLRRRERKCASEVRTFEGTCTNTIRRIAGSAGTAHFSYFRSLSSQVPKNTNFPSARRISNIVSRQSGDKFNERHLSEFLVFFGQFLDHCIVATTSNRSESMPIKVSRSDPVFANVTNGKLPFSRSLRAHIVIGSRRNERAINILSSAIDLAAVYSSDRKRAKTLRTLKNGRLRTSKGKMLPLNKAGLLNSPSNSTRFFLAGDHRSNEHPVLTALHTIFLREHNLLAKELRGVFPTWNDSQLFDMSRKINIAQFQKIVYEEFFPMLTGRRLPPYHGFRARTVPSVSIEFSTAAFRLGHTMVGGDVTRRGSKMAAMDSINTKTMFFQPSHVRKEGIENFLRGAIYQPAQEVDHMVKDSLRNFLFTNVRGEEGFDLVALNLQRGRDHALRSYNDIRQRFRGSRANSFKQITRNIEAQSRLATAYRTTDRVEAWVGLVAEDHMPRSSIGRTLFSIWRTEFLRLRDGDRFFYQRPGMFPPVIRRKFSRLDSIIYGQDTMKKLLYRNSGLRPRDIRGPVWKAKRKY